MMASSSGAPAAGRVDEPVASTVPSLAHDESTPSFVVDFHTHAFPDAIAASTIKKLSDEINGIYPVVADGSAAGLLGVMDAWGIDVSVVQPVITRPGQEGSINAWAASICSQRLVSFGAVHPDSDDWQGEIDRVVGLGLKGLKFHCEYQGFEVDDPKMLRIYDYALSHGLVLLHHAGFDPGFTPPFKSSPAQFARVVEAMQGGVIIAAHLGGHDQWDDVERHLVGSGIYLDTSMGFGFYPSNQFVRIVRDHGADKVLFASDSPWSSAADELAVLRSLPLEAWQLEAITGGNARRILAL